MNALYTPKPIVALDQRIDGLAARTFKMEGMTVAEFQDGLTRDEQVTALGYANLVGVRSKGLAAEVIERLPNLKAIGSYCLSTKNIGVDAATERGIPIFCGTDETAESVAELALLQAGNIFRGLYQQNQNLQAGRWWKENGRTLRGKTIGIIGGGVVGMATAEQALGDGMNVLVNDTRQLRLDGRMLQCGMAELLKRADVVSLHVPGGLGKPVIAAAELAAMKDTAILIDTARIDAVDVDDVIYAVRHKLIAGAAFDVFGEDHEPAKKGDDFKHPLVGIPGIYLTSHIGGSTDEGQAALARNVAARKIAYCETGQPTGAFNETALLEKHFVTNT